MQNIKCPLCGQQFLCDGLPGQEIVCPHCESRLKIPGDIEAAAANTLEIISDDEADAPPEGPQITFACPFCWETYDVSADLAGKKINCRGCSEPSIVLMPLIEQEKHTGRKKVKRKSSISSSPAQPWFYGFLENASRAGLIIAGILCLLGAGTSILIVGLNVKHGLAAVAISFLALLGFAAAYAGIVFAMAITLLLVDIGRNVRKRP